MKNQFIIDTEKRNQIVNISEKSKKVFDHIIQYADINSRYPSREYLARYMNCTTNRITQILDFLVDTEKLSKKDDKFFIPGYDMKNIDDIKKQNIIVKNNDDIPGTGPVPVIEKSPPSNPPGNDPINPYGPGPDNPPPGPPGQDKRQVAIDEVKQAVISDLSGVISEKINTVNQDIDKTIKQEIDDIKKSIFENIPSPEINYDDSQLKYEISELKKNDNFINDVIKDHMEIEIKKDQEIKDKITDIKNEIYGINNQIIDLHDFKENFENRPPDVQLTEDLQGVDDAPDKQEIFQDNMIQDAIVQDPDRKLSAILQYLFSNFIFKIINLFSIIVGIYISIYFTFFHFLDYFDFFRSLCLGLFIVFSSLISYQNFKKTSQVKFFIFWVVIISFSIVTGVKGQLTLENQKKMAYQESQIKDSSQILLFQDYTSRIADYQQDMTAKRKEREKLQEFLSNTNYDNTADKKEYNNLNYKIYLKDNYIAGIKAKIEQLEIKKESLLLKDNVKISVQQKVDFFDWLSDIIKVQADMIRLIFYFFLSVFVDVIPAMNLSILLFPSGEKKHNKK